jgi:hypothetical protein
MDANAFINKFIDLTNCEIPRYLLEESLDQLENYKNLYYNEIISIIESLDRKYQHASCIYLVYHLLITFIKNDIVDNYMLNIRKNINTLVNLNYIEFLSSGKSKLIINDLINELNNDNFNVSNVIINIFDHLTPRQLFILKYIKINNNPLFNDLEFKCDIFFSIENGNYFYKKYDNNDESLEKNKTINELETIYDNKSKRNYFSFAINKLFNKCFGITHINNKLSLNYEQLKYCLYFACNNKYDIHERFHNFANVLKNKQLIYIGI